MEEGMTRRDMLAKWTAVALGGVVAATFPSKAQAANEDPIKIGQTNTGAASTALESPGVPVLTVEYSGPDELGFAADSVAIEAGRIKAFKEGAGASLYAESRGGYAIEAY